MASAAQLAARRRFAAAVRAGAFKNPGRRRVRRNEFNEDLIQDADKIIAAHTAAKPAKEKTVAKPKGKRAKKPGKKKPTARRPRRAAAKKAPARRPRRAKRAAAPRPAAPKAKRAYRKRKPDTSALGKKITALRKALEASPKRSHKRRAMKARYAGLSILRAARGRRWKSAERSYVAKYVRVNARRRRRNARRYHRRNPRRYRRHNPRRRHYRRNPFSMGMLKKVGVGLVSAALVVKLGKVLGDMVRPTLTTSLPAVAGYTTPLVSAVIAGALFFGIKKIGALAMLRPYAMPIALGAGAAAVLHAVGPQVAFLNDNMTKIGLPLGDYVSLPPPPLHAYVDNTMAAYRDVSGLGDDAQLLEAIRDSGMGALPAQDEHVRALLDAASAGADAKDGQWEESVLLSAINSF